MICSRLLNYSFCNNTTVCVCSIRGKHYIWRRGFKQKQNAENRPSDADIIGATFIHCIDLLQDNHRLEFLLNTTRISINTSIFPIFPDISLKYRKLRKPSERQKLQYQLNKRTYPSRNQIDLPAFYM